MAFSNELVLVSLLATLQGIVAVSELTTTSAKSCKTADDCPEDEGCIGVGVVNGKNRLVRCKKFNCAHISSSHVGSFKYWLPELRFYCCAKGFVERSICNFDCPHVSAYAVGSFKIKIKNWLVERSICEFNTTNAVALTNSTSTTIAAVATTNTLKVTAKTTMSSLRANGNSLGKSTSSTLTREP